MLLQKSIDLPEDFLSKPFYDALERQVELVR